MWRAGRGGGDEAQRELTVCGRAQSTPKEAAKVRVSECPED